MRIRHIRDGFEYKVYGVSRESQVMPSRGWSEVVTWFLIWEPAPVGYTSFWKWVNGNDYEPVED